MNTYNEYILRRGVTKLNTKNKKIAMGTILLTSLIGVISVSLYFTYYGTPWENKQQLRTQKNILQNILI